MILVVSFKVEVLLSCSVSFDALTLGMCEPNEFQLF